MCAEPPKVSSVCAKMSWRTGGTEGVPSITSSILLGTGQRHASNEARGFCLWGGDPRTFSSKTAGRLLVAIQDAVAYAYVVVEIFAVEVEEVVFPII